MAMFCTNCGEEMREIDKFCATCGTAAAPRPAKPRATAPELPAPVRASQSAAEAFYPPVPPTPINVANVSRPAPSPRAEAPESAPLSRQQEQQVLLEAEEIASVRGMLPIEALPPEFPPAAPMAETRRCEYCGDANPASNRFCERCGRPLHEEPAVQAASAPVVRAAVPSPITQSAWLDVPAPERPAATKPVKPPANAKVAKGPASAAPASGKVDDFFYFYDDSSTQRGSRKLLIVMMVVLALGVLGVIYLLSRPGTKSATAANVTITISPTETQVVAGEAHDFAATVSGSGDTDVLWSVAEGNAGGNVVGRGAQAQGGTVASMGVYVAPTTPGTYHVVATSKANTTKSATAEVLVSGK